MSSFDSHDDDIEVQSDEAEDVEEEYDIGFARWTKHSEIPVEMAHAVQDTKDTVRALTANEFVLEAVERATMLKHMLGDADPVVADHAGQIISSLTVLSIEIKNDPAGFMLSVARSIEDPSERMLFCTETARRLNQFVQDTHNATESEAAVQRILAR